MLLDEITASTNNKASLKIQSSGVAFRMLHFHLQDLAAKQNTNSLDCYAWETEELSVSIHKLYDLVTESKPGAVFIITQ